MSEDSGLRFTNTRFEIERGGHTAFIDYRLQNGLLDLLHTEVPAELRGSGVGAELVHSTLTWAREKGLKVLPTCPFVAAFLRRHREFADLAVKRSA
ncbi:MAG TPA: GNAT family N-acetyltransferase [Terriglobales bacterium]|nr:GNAT family N-acetyltransferase [Terriglobales bacterium]